MSVLKTETCFDPNNRATVFIESTLPNFSFMRVDKKGSAVSILLNNSVQAKQMPCGNYASFKNVAPQLNSSCQAVNSSN